MTMLIALTGADIFDGETTRRDAAVLVEDGAVAAIVGRGDIPAGIPVRDLGGGLLAPGFVDLQVNGGGGVMLNDGPSPDAIVAIAAAHRRFGTTGLLPTLISDTYDKIRTAMHAAQKAAAENPSVLGIHIEGPFLSPEKRGVHDAAMFRMPDARDLALLTSWPAGLVLVTLAPECVPEGFIAELARCGVKVSLGHSMATYAETRAALAEGLTGFTHLYNAMRPLSSRDPGPIAAALESPCAYIGMIVDGAHVSPEMLRLALRGEARPMLVTDAMPPVGGRKQSFMLYGEEMTVRDGRCTRADGTLAGAALDMATAVRNCVRDLGVPLTSALRFASTEPAEFLGLGTILGRLAPAFRADMVAFDPETIEVLDTWVAGEAAEKK